MSPSRSVRCSIQLSRWNCIAGTLHAPSPGLSSGLTFCSATFKAGSDPERKEVRSCRSLKDSRNGQRPAIFFVSPAASVPAEARIDDVVVNRPEAVGKAGKQPDVVAALEFPHPQQHLLGRCPAPGERDLIPNSRGAAADVKRQPAHQPQTDLTVELEARQARLVQILRPLESRLDGAPRLTLFERGRQRVSRPRL